MNDRDKLASVRAGERILLLPHCLRPSNDCPGKYTRQGLECQPGCEVNCTVGRLRQAALTLGYMGICVAPGGKLAIRYVLENKPRAVVAIACDKELEEGVHGIQKMDLNGNTPVMVVIPLSKDGCVDTEVDEQLALETLSLGCQTTPP